MEISSISRARCFDFALYFLGWFDGTFRYQFSSTVSSLQMNVRLLQSFDLYLTNCKRKGMNHEACLEQGEVEKDVISFRIQDLIIKRMQDLEIFCSKYFSHSRSPGLTEIKSELVILQKAIKLFFETNLNESCINFLLDYYWLRDPELVIDFIDSVSKTLAELLGAIPAFRQLLIAPVKTLQQKLVFLKSFIRFAILHGVEGSQLIDLLIHAEVVAIKVLRLISTSWSDRYDEVPNEIGLQISGLIREKINPSDPQVRDTYIHVLITSKLSRSSDILALEKNKHLVADFIDCLVHNVMELAEICTRMPVPIRNQMQKVHKGLTFLTIILRHQKKFNELCHEMKNVIGGVVCDAAIVILSPSLNQLTEEGLARETDLSLFHLLKALEFIRAEVAQVYPLTSVSGSMDFLQKNLEELIQTVQTVQKDLEFLRSFLEKIEEQSNQKEKLQAFRSRVMEVAYKADLVLNSTLVARDINLIKIEAQEIYNSISYDGETKRVTKTFIRMLSQVSAATCNEDLVGIDDEVKTIADRLIGGSRQLNVIPIVGMPGLGKTALANEVCGSPPVASYFHISAWCTISQVYSMHSLLVQLLCTISSKSPDQYLEMDKNDLAEMLYKRLKGKRYLIILDDVWDIEAWNLVKISLPNDANGSRILCTSRIQLRFNPDSYAHHLCPLTDEESWKLLQKKLFGKEGCPPTLSEVGFQIAKSCRGLPLRVVLVAGILANTAEDCWEEVAKGLTSDIVLDDEYCMKTLDLSYRCLPDDLKSCLCYFGAFQEDENIPVRGLLWLWISEGFVPETTRKSLEEVADDYLKALVDRSLVMVTKQRTMGGAKVCRIHDLVHEFCVKKAKEENFLHIIHHGKDPSSLTGQSNPRRVCDQNGSNSKISELMPFFPNLHSLLLFKKSGLMPKEEDLGSKLLRVLDLGNLVFDAYFLMEVVMPVHLRYLALHIGGIKSIPSAIANLSRLQTFLVRGNSWKYSLPDTIWNIKTLRHLCTTSSSCGFTFPAENLEVSPNLDHLDTLTLAIDPSSQRLENILTKLPSIRRLKCRRVGSREEPTRIGDRILGFDYLSQLKSLNLHFFYGYGFTFPLNLKKLTLSNNKQLWSEISTIGKLPNLEVLKLNYDSFVGEEWEMEEEEFPKLRVLKLLGLNFHSWIASSGNFPCLEKLVVYECWKLKEMPSCLGECPTLEMIEVKGCGESVVSLVKQIQQVQMDMGNEDLKIVIENCGDADARSSLEEE